MELHGFLSYLVRCNLEGREYKVFGYKGKQVRDNIHSEDVASFMGNSSRPPRVGEVYNLGRRQGEFLFHSRGVSKSPPDFSGGNRSTPMWRKTASETTFVIIAICGKSGPTFPTWDIRISLKETIRQIVAAWQKRLSSQ